MSYQRDFVTDENGIVTEERMFSPGGHQDSMERVVKPTGPRPGYEVQVRWGRRASDGAAVLRIGEVAIGEIPKKVDELDTMDIKQLLTIGGRERVFIDGAEKIGLNSSMPIEEMKAHIRANRQRKKDKPKDVGLDKTKQPVAV